MSNGQGEAGALEARLSGHSQTEERDGWINRPYHNWACLKRQKGTVHDALLLFFQRLDGCLEKSILLPEPGFLFSVSLGLLLKILDEVSLAFAETCDVHAIVDTASFTSCLVVLHKRLS